MKKHPKGNNSLRGEDKKSRTVPPERLTHFYSVRATLKIAPWAVPKMASQSVFPASDGSLVQCVSNGHIPLDSIIPQTAHKVNTFNKKFKMQH